MKTIRFFVKPIALILTGIILLSSCASATLIESFPSEAKVYVNGEFVGKTPHRMEDTKISGTTSSIRLEKEGYSVMNASICKNEQANVGAIIGGMFFIFPFLWIMEYKPNHMYNLTPNTEESKEPSNQSPDITPVKPRTKAERLLELNELYEKGILTKEEFQLEKEKILNEK